MRTGRRSHRQQVLSFVRVFLTSRGRKQPCVVDPSAAPDGDRTRRRGVADDSIGAVLARAVASSTATAAAGAEPPGQPPSVAESPAEPGRAAGRPSGEGPAANRQGRAIGGTVPRTELASVPATPPSPSTPLSAGRTSASGGVVAAPADTHEELSPVAGLAAGRTAGTTRSTLGETGRPFAGLSAIEEAPDERGDEQALPAPSAGKFACSAEASATKERNCRVSSAPARQRIEVPMASATKVDTLECASESARSDQPREQVTAGAPAVQEEPPLMAPVGAVAADRPPGGQQQGGQTEGSVGGRIRLLTAVRNMETDGIERQIIVRVRDAEMPLDALFFTADRIWPTGVSRA